MDLELEDIICTILSLEEDYATLPIPLRNMNNTLSPSGEIENVLSAIDQSETPKDQNTLETALELCSYFGYQQHEKNSKIMNSDLNGKIGRPCMDNKSDLVCNQNSNIFKRKLSENEKETKRSTEHNDNSLATSSGIRFRKKTVYNREQTAFLQCQFDLNPYPDFVTRCRIANIAGIPEPRIQVWFQNRRARHLCKPGKSPELKASPPEGLPFILTHAHCLQKTYGVPENPRNTWGFQNASLIKL